MNFYSTRASVSAVFRMGDGSEKKFTRLVQGSSSEYKINEEVRLLTSRFLLHFASKRRSFVNFSIFIVFRWKKSYSRAKKLKYQHQRMYSCILDESKIFL